jgi:hypothetical protein
MRRFITDMADAPVHAFAAPHKIWCCIAQTPTVSLQSSHAKQLTGAREAGKRSGK